MKKMLLIIATFWIAIIASSQEKIQIIGWNVESGGNDPDYISDRIADFDGIDIIGLCEVKLDNSKDYERAASVGESAKFKSVISNTGKNDRLQIIYNSKKFDLIKTSELHYINIDGTVRAPFLALFKDNESKKEFIFMVNHLARGDKKNGTEYRRNVQAQKLNEWVKNIGIPVIAVGDYNFDYNIENEKHDKAYDSMIMDDNFIWVKPEELLRTQCNMEYAAAVLDFIFINKLAKEWDFKSKIYTHEDDCELHEQNSDHKAVWGEFLIN